MTEHNYLRVGEFLASAGFVKDVMVPASPALYVWVREISDASSAAFAARADKLFGETLRIDNARVGPYAEVRLAVNSPMLGKRKLSLLKDGIREVDFNWAKTLMIEWQRPLYVGITVNMRDRLEAHLRQGSRLRSYMSAGGVEPSQCGVYVYEPPDWGDVVWKDSNEAGLDLDQEVPVPQEVVTTLRTAEAILIRLAQPLLNRSME